MTAANQITNTYTNLFAGLSVIVKICKHYSDEGSEFIKIAEPFDYNENRKTTRYLWR